MVSKGEMWVFNSSCITQLQNQITTDSIAHNCISPLLTIEYPVAQWLEHPTRSRRVVGSNPIWGSDFSEFPVGSCHHLICVYHSHIRSYFFTPKKIY